MIKIKIIELILILFCFIVLAMVPTLLVYEYSTRNVTSLRARVTALENSERPLVVMSPYSAVYIESDGEKTKVMPEHLWAASQKY